MHICFYMCISRAYKSISKNGYRDGHNIRGISLKKWGWGDILQRGSISLQSDIQIHISIGCQSDLDDGAFEGDNARGSAGDV